MSEFNTPDPKELGLSTESALSDKDEETKKKFLSLSDDQKREILTSIFGRDKLIDWYHDMLQEQTNNWNYESQMRNASIIIRELRNNQNEPIPVDEDMLLKIDSYLVDKWEEVSALLEK